MDGQWHAWRLCIACLHRAWLNMLHLGAPWCSCWCHRLAARQGAVGQLAARQSAPGQNRTNLWFRQDACIAHHPRPLAPAAGTGATHSLLHLWRALRSAREQSPVAGQTAQRAVGAVAHVMLELFYLGLLNQSVDNQQIAIADTRSRASNSAWPQRLLPSVTRLLP